MPLNSCLPEPLPLQPLVALHSETRACTGHYRTALQATKLTCNPAARRLAASWEHSDVVIQNQSRRGNSANPRAGRGGRGRGLLAPQICTKSFFLTSPVFHLPGSCGAVRKYIHAHTCTHIQVYLPMCICSHTGAHTKCRAEP